MKRLIQVAVGAAVMFGIAPFTYGTPLHDGMVFISLFVGAMYATALLQHYWAHRRPRRSVIRGDVWSPTKGWLR